ncbi:STAS domain-containing protein [Streptosporangium lutulentum]
MTGEYQRLVLDLSGLTFCDSTGIKVFLALRTLIDERSGAIALTDLHPRLDKVFQMTGLGQLFAVYPARADALNLMRAQPSAP